MSQRVPAVELTADPGSIVFRVDGSRRIGAGHIARCTTLARRLVALGADVTFLSRDHADGVCDLITHQDLPLVRLPPARADDALETDPQRPRVRHASWLDAAAVEDAAQTRAAIAELGVRPRWLVVDHYAIDREWERQVRGAVDRIMVIDDLADRDHDCDVLLDQNLIENWPKRYAGRVGPYCRQLLGPRFALIGDEYRLRRAQVTTRAGRLERILVYFGAADTANLLGRVLAVLHRVDRDALQVDAVTSPSSEHIVSLRGQAAADPRVTLHEGLPSLAPLMARADLAIGAGGATTWERLCLGLPAMVLTIAENQRPIAKTLHDLGLVRWLGDAQAIDNETLDRGIQDLLCDELDEAWSQRCAAAVDGRGLDRVVQAMGHMALFPLRARRANAADERLLLGWANDPQVRRQAFDPAAIPETTHHEWLAGKLANQASSRLFIVETSNDEPIGQVRFENLGREWEIHYSLAPASRGQGLGADLLRTALAALHLEFGPVPIKARVKPNNTASRSVLERIGFLADGNGAPAVVEYRY